MADRRQQGLARILASDGAAFDAQDALSALGTYNSQLPPEPKAYSQRLGEALLTTWPAQMAKSAFQAATLPGDVYAGKVDPLSEQGIGRALDLAGLVTLSSGAFPAAKGAGQELRAGIKAYHGSPHDFDKFQLSKIGTGEGAQAYGHGLYFAESEAVAKSYRDALTRTSGNAANDWASRNPALSNEARTALDTFAKANNMGPADDNLFALMLSSTKDGYAPDAFAPELAARLKQSWEKPAGHMYEVNINADPAKMLDYDMPLPMGHSLRGEFDQAGRQLMQAGEDGFSRNVGREAAMAARNESLTGDGAYRNMTNLMEANRASLVGKYGDEAMFASPSELARRELLERGIPGIKYLDQGSRSVAGGELLGVMPVDGGFVSKVKVSNRGGAGFTTPTDSITTSRVYKTAAEAEAWAADKINAGTRNFVIFDDSLIDIMRKYGVGSLAALPPAVLAGVGITPDQAQAADAQRATQAAQEIVRE